MAYDTVKVDLETSYRTEVIRAISGSSTALELTTWTRTNVEEKYEYHVLDKATALAGAETESESENTTAVAKWTGKALWWVIEVTKITYGEWTIVEPEV